MRTYSVIAPNRGFEAPSAGSSVLRLTRNISEQPEWLLQLEYHLDRGCPQPAEEKTAIPINITDGQAICLNLFTIILAYSQGQFIESSLNEMAIKYASRCQNVKEYR